MKPNIFKFIFLILNIVILSSLGWSQCDGCNSGIVRYLDIDGNLIDCDEWVTNIDDCYQSDLDVLQIFIDNSSETIDMDMDDNGNGIIELMELGKQKWVDGRITNLECGWIDDNGWNYCEVSGSIPSEIENLTNLTYLSFYGNQLTGSIPPEVGNLTNLTYLFLSGNLIQQFTGEIPSTIGNLTNLIHLDLLYNQLSGSIPPEIGNLINLNRLNLSYNNQLTGPIPPEIGNLINLSHLFLNNNQLTGEIPNSICDIYPNLDTFDISDNNLCPPYPECIEDYIGEQECDLSIIDNLISTTYNLSSPYPNPFNPSTTISFSIPQSGMVSLNVYDITGKLITTLINEQLNIGYHSIDWDGTNQSSGMYLVRMESGEYVETQKLLLVK